MPRLGPLLGALLIVSVAGTVLSAVEAPSASPDRPSIDEAAVRPALPERFVPWPPFVLTWRVTGPIRQEGSVFSAGLSWNPCGTVGSTPCHIRLAWEDYRTWSVTVSPDPAFDDRDVHRLTIGPLHYGVGDGVVRGVRDSSFLPPVGTCDDVLLIARRTESVDAVRSAADPPAPAHWSILTLTLPTGEYARCLGPSGIPLSFSRQGHAWEPADMVLASPTPREVGAHLVAAQAVQQPILGCVGFAATPGGRWLADLADRQGSYTVEPGDRGLELRNPLLTGQRAALVWLTGSDSPPEGHRRREIAPDLVAAEVLRPTPILTVELEGSWLWVAFPEEIEPFPVLLEQAAYQLGTVARDLAARAERLPSPHAPPGC